MSGGGSGGSQTQTTEPWSGAKPHLLEVYDKAKKLNRRQMPVYDPAGFTAPERIAQNRMLGIARQGAPEAITGAADELTRTVGGQYLSPDSNPHLRGMYEAATEPMVEQFRTEVLPSVTGQFGAAGRFGSGAHQAAVDRATGRLTDTLGDVSSEMYGKAYADERGRMLQGAALAPSVGGLERDIELANAGLYGDVGMARREMLEARRGAAEERAMEPWNRLQMKAQLLGTGSPFSATSSSGPGRNKLAGGLGGAATGAALGSMVMPGWGTAIGAGMGGLMGVL